MGWQNFGTLRVCFGGIHHQWLLEWNSFCRATLPFFFFLVWNFISLLRWFLEFRTRDSSDGSELTVPPVTPVVCLLFPLWSKLIFCLRCQRTDNTLLSTSCRDQRICFCVFITIVRRRFAFLFVGAGADAGLLTSWLTGFNFWRRLCTLPGLLALNSMHRPQQTRNSFWDCFRARWLIRVSIVRDLQVFQIFRLIGTSCGTNGHPISPLLFCLGLGPPVKSESGFTSHVQTEEACDGSPFFSFPSLWHPLPSWHKFAPNWHKIVWQNAASHILCL